MEALVMGILLDMIFFARFDLHFSQVISFRSVIVPALRYLVTLSAFSRLIPQPVFLSFSVPWTKSLPTAVIKVISIRFSKPKGRNHQRSPLYGSGRRFPSRRRFIVIAWRTVLCTNVHKPSPQISYNNIIHYFFKKINTFLKFGVQNYTLFNFFGGNNKKLSAFLSKTNYKSECILHKIPYKLRVLCKNIFLNVPVRRCLHLVNILCLNTPAEHYFMQT